MAELAAPRPTIVPNWRGAAGLPLRAARAVRWRRLLSEGVVMFVVAFAFYIAVAVYLVLDLHYLTRDAYTRVANAQFVLFSRDPHLAAVGFIWPPLPALLDAPLLLLKGWFPVLATHGFAGSVEAAAFSAGTAVLLNSALRELRVARPLRWLLYLAFVLHPMVIIYAIQGMSEAMFDFFVVGSLLGFLRWTRRGRAIDLTLAGAMVGLGSLVRYEILLVFVVLVCGVAIVAYSRSRSWRETETNLLLFGVPVAFLFGVWVVASGVIEGDAFFAFHSYYSSENLVVVGGVAGSDPQLRTLAGAGRYIFQNAAALCPAVIPLLGLLALRFVFLRDRLVSLVLILLAFPVLVFDARLLSEGKLAADGLRYQIYVIPYAFAAGTALLGDARRLIPRFAPIAALLAVGVFAVSDALSLYIVNDPVKAPYERPAITAAMSHQRVTDPNHNPIDDSRTIALAVASFDSDHGLVAVDTFLGFGIPLGAPDPKLYLITSDEDFKESIAAPQLFGVKYFLVPRPGGFGDIDSINRLYPGLWQNGAGVATLTADLGTTLGWRLYRITETPNR